MQVEVQAHMTLNSATAISQLTPGETGIVEGIHLPEERQLHFLELGIVPGETLRYIRRSPWKDPIIVEVLGVQLAIRSSDASAIMVRRPEKRK